MLPSPPPGHGFAAGFRSGATVAPLPRRALPPLVAPVLPPPLPETLEVSDLPGKQLPPGELARLFKQWLGIEPGGPTTSQKMVLRDHHQLLMWQNAHDFRQELRAMRVYGEGGILSCECAAASRFFVLPDDAGDDYRDIYLHVIIAAARHAAAVARAWIESEVRLHDVIGWLGGGKRVAGGMLHVVLRMVAKHGESLRRASIFSSKYYRRVEDSWMKSFEARSLSDILCFKRSGCLFCATGATVTHRCNAAGMLHPPAFSVGLCSACVTFCNCTVTCKACRHFDKFFAKKQREPCSKCGKNLCSKCDWLGMCIECYNPLKK